MTTAFERPHLESGILLLADISGYSAFLGLVAAEHPEMVIPEGEVPPAYPVLSSLLDVVVETITPAFTVSEIEGDAVFGYAPDARFAADGASVLDVVRSAYTAFRARVDEAMHLHKHDCEACMIFPTLELKFVVHHGPTVIQQIAGRERLLGPAVNLAHRLLKNSVTDETGRRAYALVTETAARKLQLSAEIGIPHRERYPDVGAVEGIVIGLDAARAAAV